MGQVPTFRLSVFCFCFCFKSTHDQLQPLPRLSWVVDKCLRFLRRMYFEEEQKVQCGKCQEELNQGVT